MNMKLKRIIYGGLFLLAMLATTGMAFGLPALLAAGGLGLTLAMAVGVPVAGTMTEQAIDEGNSHILMPDVVKKIIKIRPDNYPMDVILRTIGGQKTNSFMTRFYSLGVRDLMTTVKTAVRATDGSSAATKVHAVTLNSDAFADTNELLMFQGIKGSDSFDLVGRVISKEPTTNTYTIQLLNGVGTNGADIPQIAQDTKVSRIGQAMNELDARSDDYGNLPEDDYNYAQIIMSTISQGLYAKMMKKEVDFGLDDLRENALYDFRQKCEGSALFGVRSVRTHNGKRFYTMGGIYRKVVGNKKIAISKSDSVKSSVVDIANGLFTGNNGSDTRIMFAGNNVLAWLSKNAEYEKQMNANMVETTFGIRFSKIDTMWGRILIRPHKAFSFYGLDDQALIIDPEHLGRRVLKPMGVRHIDNKKNGTELSDSYVIEEAFCPIVTNPDVHAVVGLTD